MAKPLRGRPQDFPEESEDRFDPSGETFAGVLVTLGDFDNFGSPGEIPAK